MKNTLFDKNELSLKRELNSDSARSGKIAMNWLSQSPIYISTKTSGTGQYAELIEIAILDSDQRVLFHSQMKPSVAIDDDAVQAHAINLSALMDRPSWAEIAPKVADIIKNRRIIMYDVLFETRIMKQTCLAFALDIEWVDQLSIDCAMQLATNTYGTDNRYGASIDYAMQKANIIGYKGDTGAVAATYALIQLIKNIAEYTQRLEHKIANKKIELAG